MLFLFLAEVFFGELLQPLGWDFRGQSLSDEIESLKDVAEYLVELVEIALVLHERGARQVVEVFDPPPGEVLLHRLHQRQIFAQRYRQAGLLQLMKKGGEHHPILDPRSGVQRGIR